MIAVIGSVVVYQRAPENLDVDHIVEVEDGGKPFSLDNLLTRCRSCHKVKTAAARKARFVKENRWRMWGKPHSDPKASRQTPMGQNSTHQTKLPPSFD
jgi:5-methylcytosine-specific restriction endonuclease McrA